MQPNCVQIGRDCSSSVSTGLAFWLLKNAFRALAKVPLTDNRQPRIHKSWRPRLFRVLIFIMVCGLLSFGQRPYYLSATGSQATPNQTPLHQQHTPAFPISAVAQDVEVISVFPEHLGFPVDLFLNTAPPPATHPWTVEITKLANAAKGTGKHIALNMALIRDYPVSRAYLHNGELKLDRTWLPRCYDMSNDAIGALIGQAYVNYARWLTNLFLPKYVIVMAEINVYYANCLGDTSGWRALVNVERAAYDAIRATNLSIPIFPSFKLEELYGNSLTGFDTAQYDAFANLKRDFFGISAYPSGLPMAGGVMNPYVLPADYLSRVKDRRPQEKRLLITETGWNSQSIAIHYQGACVPYLTFSDPSFTHAYLNYVLYYAWLNDFEMVTWWSDRDLIPANVMDTCYPPLPAGSAACNGDLWCLSVAQYQADYSLFWPAPFSELVFKVFGTMGLRDYAGNPKPGTTQLWQQVLAIPRRP
jgi:hypothetical protein